MEQLEESWIMLDGNLVYYYIKRKKIKNMYMRFSSDGRLIITTPNSCKLEMVEKFLKDKKTWVLKQFKFQERIRYSRENEEIRDGDNLYFLGKKYSAKLISGEQNFVNVCDEFIEIIVKEKYIDNNDYVKKVYEEWLKKRCLNICFKYIDIYCEKMELYKIPFPDVEIKKFKSRWGCCIPKKKKVEFAMNLVKTPEECIEYVVVHELAHFKYIYHDKKFYDFVGLFIPNWSERRNFLNREYGRIIV